MTKLQKKIIVPHALYLRFAVCLLLFLFVTLSASAANLPQNLLGKLLLSAESHGEIYYINPIGSSWYSLGRPKEAFDLARSLGIGITNQNLAKIPESSTNCDKASSFVLKQKGKIFLQVESRGEAWYINPTTCARHYLGNASLMFEAMRNLSLGISNDGLNTIKQSLGHPVNQKIKEGLYNKNDTESDSGKDVLVKAARIIDSIDPQGALKYFSTDLQNPMRFTLNFLKTDGRNSLANLLLSSQLESQNTNQKIYLSEADSPLGEKIQFHWKLKNQPNGEWLIEDF